MLIIKLLITVFSTVLIEALFVIDLGVSAPLMEHGIHTQLVKVILERQEMVVIVVQDPLEDPGIERRRVEAQAEEMEIREKTRLMVEIEEIKETM